MGLSYRKKSGPLNFSVSGKGVRVTAGSGCLLSLACWLLLFTACVPAIRTTAQATPEGVQIPAVSAAQFAQIQNGMTLQQVEQIMGGPGEVQSDGDTAGIRTTMYAWPGRGELGANCNVMIQSGKVCMKAQYGLR